MDEITGLVAALKSLTQGEGQDERTLPVAEDGWNTRPDADSYGIVYTIEFEADALNGDNVKQAVANEGSFDLYSRKRDGDGWIPLIKAALTEYCGASWKLNHRAHETETGLWHWEWSFQTEE